ncbi:MAG: DUF1127 domain-containing protein [Rhodobacteraceae bacterium]|nr:DUF1127 domain-containing protein [Paracoccaceae bacterium]
MTYITDQHACTPRRASLLNTLRIAINVSRQRRALRLLDDSALDDVGLTREEAQAEARRPFWDAPDFWRR